MKSDKTDGMDWPTTRAVPDHGENPHTRIRVAEELPRTDMAIVLVITDIKLLPSLVSCIYIYIHMFSDIYVFEKLDFHDFV